MSQLYGNHFKGMLHSSDFPEVAKLVGTQNQHCFAMTGSSKCFHDPISKNTTQPGTAAVSCSHFCFLQKTHEIRHSTPQSRLFGYEQVAQEYLVSDSRWQDRHTLQSEIHIGSTKTSPDSSNTAVHQGLWNNHVLASRVVSLNQ